MIAAIRKAAPFVAIAAAAALLAGCAVEPAPVYDAYYTGPSAVFVEPIHPYYYHYGFYHYGYGPGYRPGGYMHGRG